MHYCSITYSQLDPANIEHNNDDDDVDDGQADDHDIYSDHITIIDGQDDDFDYMTINLNLCYGNIQSYSVLFS